MLIGALAIGSYFMYRSSLGSSSMSMFNSKAGQDEDEEKEKEEDYLCGNCGNCVLCDYGGKTN